MTIQWQTNIPKNIYAKLYCNWKRVKRDVEILSRIFNKYGAKSLVEFGCGIGRHGYLLSRIGFKVLLTDAVDWRYGVSCKLPFIKLDVLDDDVDIDNNFDAGYGVNFLTIFNYRDIVKILNKLSRLINNGLLVFDYNFVTYQEPRVREVEISGRKYYAMLVEERVESIENGFLYKYEMKVIDNNGRLIGVEKGEYPVYNRETLFKAIREAGYEVVDIVWVSWDPTKYIYEYTSNESDSAFLVLMRK